MGKWEHRLSNVDQLKRTAVCSKCGDVKVGRSRGRFFRCRVALNETRNKKIYKEQNKPPGVKCHICGRGHRIAYDHDHKTGKFRGWLCFRCNVTLGAVEDSIDILNKMIQYLDRID